jgi:uncharacterized protein with gpF-like domain
MDSMTGINTSIQPVLRPIWPNEGLKIRYYKSILALVEEMSTSYAHWLQAQYNDAPPALAQDALPSAEMKKRLSELAKRWRKRFDEAAPRIARAYLKGQFKATDSAMRRELARAGISVRFKMTAAMRDAFAASLDENIALIRNIPAQYHLEAGGIVSRSYAAGRDLGTMTKELRALYPKAQRRVALIARDQSNKANAVVEKARRLELGIEEAIWMHSGGGKHPRRYHQAASGRRYKVAEGCPIKDERSGKIEYIMPGQKINCRCVSRSVLPGLKTA